jgi:hypothetical protein
MLPLTIEVSCFCLWKEWLYHEHLLPRALDNSFIQYSVWTIGVENENDKTHHSMQAFGKEKCMKTTIEIARDYSSHRPLY